MFATFGAPVLNFLDGFKTTLKAQIDKDEQNFNSNFTRLIQEITNGKTCDELVPMFQRPICAIARPKAKNAGGESNLDTWHIPLKNPPTPCESNGFKIPLLLGSLFDNSADLKKTIPQILYLAELIGIGHFEISATAKYVNNNSSFTGSHTALNKFSYYHNNNFKFEVFFVTTQRTKICEFDCHTDQLPVNQLTELGQICDIGGKRTAALSRMVPVEEFWSVGSVLTKLVCLGQVPKFTRANGISKTLANEIQYLAAVKQNVQARITEIKLMHQAFLQAPVNRGNLANEAIATDASLNLIVAFMQVCGFDHEAIARVRQLDRRLGGGQTGFQQALDRILQTAAAPAENQGLRRAEVALMLNALNGLESEQLVLNPNAPLPALPQEENLSDDEAAKILKELLRDIDKDKS